MKADRTALASLLKQARHALAFTGAGLSTECGIPDFRSPGGIWSRFTPIPFQDFMASQAARNESWRRKFIVDDSFAGARPGRGHRFIAAAIKAGWMHAIITQNIDNLHQDSGIEASRIVELHGNGTYAKCLICHSHYTLGDIRARFEAAGGEAPDCEHCGGPVKSATIAFGQAMPEAELRRADEWARCCDLMLVLGSSLVVYPAASLVPIAKEAGADLVIINREPTAYDDIADIVIRDDIGDVLSDVAALMRGAFQ